MNNKTKIIVASTLFISYFFIAMASLGMSNEITTRFGFIFGATPLILVMVGLMILINKK